MLGLLYMRLRLCGRRTILVAGLHPAQCAPSNRAVNPSPRKISKSFSTVRKYHCRKTGTAAGMSSVSPRFDDRCETQSHYSQRFPGLLRVGLENAYQLALLRELRKALTMKAERHGAIVPGKLREFLTNVAAI